MKGRPLDSDAATDRFYRTIWPHAALLLRTALLLCHHQTEAEDVSQETLLKAFKSIDQLHEGDDARPWLLTILRHVRIDRIRSAAAKHTAVSLDGADMDPADDESPVVSDVEAWSDPNAMLQQFSNTQMIDGLKALPEEIRWTLLLVDVEGIDQQDAAAVLGVPVGTVKSRSSRGRAMLRKALLPLAQELRMVR